MNQITTQLKDIVTIDNLYDAYKSAVKSKGLKKRIANFQANLSVELYKLYNELINGTYKPQPCHHFEIWCTAGQKTRQISAPAIRDCVVQHLIYQQICPQFDKYLIYASYGCRSGKGTHRASKYIRNQIQKYHSDHFYLQIDIRKYYYNIHHNTLRRILLHYIQDDSIVDLMISFCQNSNGIGLDVGCLLSQFYGLIFLNYFDHYCKRVLKIKSYARYVDDVVILGYSKQDIINILHNIQQLLTIKLSLSLSKYRINKLKTGINFVGYRMWHKVTLIRKRSIHHFHKALAQGRYDSLNGLLAHSYHTNSYWYMLKIIRQMVPITNYTHLPKFARYDIIDLT